MVRKSRIDPARYVSCVISALSIIGPAVGRPNTMAVIAPPDIRCGNNQARLLIKGFRQILTGYLNNTFALDKPLLRAVITYCFSSSSSSVARSTRMRPAEPPVATTNTGIGKCLAKSMSYAILHGASINSLEYSPLRLTPKYLRPMNNNTSASMKLGIASPINPQVVNM